jgi:hypothetical protein
MRGRGIGAARGRATIQRGTFPFLLFFILIRRWEVCYAYRRINSSGIGGDQWVIKGVMSECRVATECKSMTGCRLMR